MPSSCHMCTMFGDDSSNCFSITAQTHTHTVTYATDHPSHASATAAWVMKTEYIKAMPKFTTPTDLLHIGINRDMLGLHSSFNGAVECREWSNAGLRAGPDAWYEGRRGVACPSRLLKLPLQHFLLIAQLLRLHPNTTVSAVRLTDNRHGDHLPSQSLG